MFLIYVLWLSGIIFTIIFLVETGIVIYNLMKKNEKKIKGNIVMAIICAIISIIFISSAFFVGVKTILKSNINYSEISRSIGESSADITANMYKSFKKRWDDGVKNTE